MADNEQQIVELQVSEDSRRDDESVTATSQVIESEPAETLRPQNGDLQSTTDHDKDSNEDSDKEDANNEDDDGEVVCEVELDLTPLEKSRATANKLNCISGVIVTVAAVLFIFSFPFSLILILFCFDTKRSCVPFLSIRKSPWRLFLTKKTLHYHLPNPPERPYINVFYCLQRVSVFLIPLKDIKSVSVQSEQPRNENIGDSITSSRLQNIIIELKSESPGVRAPVGGVLGLCSREITVYSLVLYSVKDASDFVENIQQCLNEI